MSTLFKPVRPYPLPANAEIVDKDGKRHARVRDRGKWVLFPLSADGKQYLKPALKWAADVRMADGTRRRMRFSPNRDASAVMLADLIKKIEAERSGVRDQYADHRLRPLSELLAEYKQHHSDRGNTPKQAEQTRRRCELVFQGNGFVLLSDLDTAAVERWPAERRGLTRGEGGISAQTSNHYTTALKAFGNWLIKARCVSENPFRHLGRVNTRVDVRHVRRPLTADEFARLLTAARAGDSFRGLSGPDRAMLYLIAGMTGLRASELASLTPDSFALAADPPVVAVEAAYSKHRRRDEVPLHRELVSELRSWFVGRAGAQPLWPGKWALHNEASDLIKHDLRAARAVWLAEAATPEEKAERETSGVLLYRDHDGRVADFHSLRHRFVTELVNAGVAPKDAKELARHSSITTTMDRYAHVGVRDTAGAVEKLRLPSPAARRGATNAPEGTAGDRGGTGAATGAADSDDEQGPAETSEETPSSVGNNNPPESLGKEGFRGQVRSGEKVHPRGVEPLTFGSVAWCTCRKCLVF